MPGLVLGSQLPRRRPAGPLGTTTAYGICEPQWTVYEPTPFDWEASPYARVPLPPLSASLELNPLLRLSDSPTIRWFVDQPPEEALPVPSKRRPPALWQATPAFTTADPNATVVVHIPRFNHPLVIRPYGLTINKLFRAIYTMLREESTREEFRTYRVPYTSEFHTSILLGQQAQSPPFMVHECRDDQVSVNVRRLMDFKTLFKGLSPSPHEPDVWLLHTTEGLPAK